MDIAKTTGEAWTHGQKLYWDNTAKKLTTTAAGNTLVGAAAQAQAAGDSVGRALITGQIA
jgi:predicted RecA/RadA family phage recombinase